MANINMYCKQKNTDIIADWSGYDGRLQNRLANESIGGLPISDIKCQWS